MGCLGETTRGVRERWLGALRRLLALAIEFQFAEAAHGRLPAYRFGPALQDAWLGGEIGDRCARRRDDAFLGRGQGNSMADYGVRQDSGRLVTGEFFDRISRIYGIPCRLVLAVTLG